MEDGRTLLSSIIAVLICVETFPKLNFRESALAARGITDVLLSASFHVHAWNFAEKKMHVPAGIIAAQRSHTVEWLAAISKT